MRRYWLVGLLALCGCDDDGGADPDPGQQGEVPDAAALEDAGAPAPDMAAVEDAAPSADAEAADPDAAVEVPDAGPPPPVLGACGAGQVTGWLYADADEGDRSRYAAERLDDDPPIAEPLTLVSADGAREVTPCADGSFAIDEIAEGAHLLVPPQIEGHRCSRRNCAPTFAAAMQAGGAVVVTIGDSIPVVGDAPMFPARLATLFGGVAPVESRNVARGGSTSPDWLPGAPLYEQRLAPVMADADVLVISIGGNDILEYVSNPAILQDIPAAIEGAKELVEEIAGRVVVIVEAVREVNPDVDVVYCLYPDYSQATSHPLWGLAGRFLGPGTMRDVLETAMANIPADQDILLADMLNGWEGLDVGLYLYDALHFNDAGQSLYAEEVFRTLGGVLIGESPLGATGATPLGTEHSFGYVAE